MMDKDVFGADGLIVKAGYVTLYRYNEITMEYHGRDTEFRRANISVPAHSCVDEPLSSKAGFTVCRKKDLTGREYIVDFLWKTAYDTQSGFDQWNGQE